jgi:hypothetical protein
MMRKENWPELLIAEIERHRKLPFSWGESNCFYFPMDCAKAITGIDLWERERGCTSETDFKRRLVDNGLANLAEAFAQVFQECPPAFARRGDIGVVEYQGILCGVMVEGVDVVGKTLDGTLRVPRSLLKRAFRID